MATVPLESAVPAAPPRPLQPLAGLLSYLVPGLGQIVQGRVTKGLLFLVCIYALFFYGLCLGSASATLTSPGDDKTETFRLGSNVYLPDTADLGRDGRPAPSSMPKWVTNLYNRPQFLGQFWAGVVVWPAVWQYSNPDSAAPMFGAFMREPKDRDLNAVNTSSDKLIDLGWVFTVIAGVLNIMVIYDAVAGPAFPSPRPDAPRTEG